MNDLSLYGWNRELAEQKQALSGKDFEHGRVIVTHKTCYEVISDTDVYSCELSGNLLFGREPSEYPCTGDWVIFQPVDFNKGIIVDLLPRRKALCRLKPGTVSEKQAIASHVDKAFIVQSLDNYFSVRRIERFMVQVSEEGIEPVLVLTKTDLGYDKNKVEQELKHLIPKIPVFYTSYQNSQSTGQLKAYLHPGETVVFIGMSGVGKSTLINALFGQEIMPTSTISQATGKGRHTSTRREMVLLDGAGVLIDTPGVKLFGVTSDENDSLSDVMDISRFEGQCRFSDCRHVDEKGCAVLRAVEEGLLDKEVYDHYLRLRKESWHYSASVYEKRQYERSFSKMVRAGKQNRHK